MRDDTPTQEGVGREEIALRVRKIIDDALNSAIPEPWEVAKHATQRILSLLPAPKPGEGSPWRCRVCGGEAMLGDICSLQCVNAERAKPQQPAPGAPDGWQRLLKAAKALSFSPYPAHGSGWIPMVEGNLEEFKSAIEEAEAALTSSSAKPVGEGHPMADPWRASAELLTAQNEALAQSNRRLREGLGPFAKCVGMLLFQDEPDDTVLLLRRAESDDAATQFKLAPTVGDFRRAAAAVMGEGRAKLPSDGDLAALGNLLITHEHGMEPKDVEAVRRCYDYLSLLRRQNLTGLRRVLHATRPTPSKDNALGDAQDRMGDDPHSA